MPRSTLLLLLFLLLAPVFAALAQVVVPLRHVVRRSVTGNVLTITNVEDLFFVGDIMFGTPPQSLSVQYDTGSAILWVASTKCTSQVCSIHKRFDSTKSSSFQPSVMNFNETYGDKSNSYGVLGADTVSIGGITIQNQQFGLAAGLENGFQERQIDGLLGLGMFFTNGSALENSAYVEPLQNMFDQKLISKRLFSFALHTRSTAAGANGGEVMFGDINTNKFIGNLTYVKIVNGLGGLPLFWAIQLDGVAVGNNDIGSFKVASAIVDTGSSYLYVPQALWASFSDALGAFVDKVVGLTWVDCDKSKGLNITYTIKGQPFPLTSAYWMAQVDGTDDRVQSARLGGSYPSYLDSGLSKYCYGKIGVIPGDTWFLSVPFLQYYYAVFDVDNLRVGFAPQIGTGANPINAASTLGPFGLLFLAATVATVVFIT